MSKISLYEIFFSDKKLIWIDSVGAGAKIGNYVFCVESETSNNCEIQVFVYPYFYTKSGIMPKVNSIGSRIFDHLRNAASVVNFANRFSKDPSYRKKFLINGI